MRNVILAAVLAAFSFNASAALVDNVTFTTDTVSGLDWLDLDLTDDISYAAMVAETSSGGEFEGWSIASAAQIYELFDNAGGDGDYSDANNQVIQETLYPLWGQMQYYTGESWFHYFDETPSSTTSGIRIKADSSVTDSSSMSTAGLAYPNRIGTALVRTSTVPVSAAVWLFGSGLGLLGWMRRKAS